MDLEALTAVWPADHLAAGVIHRGEVQATVGERDRVFELASVTKLLTAWAVLVAVEEETTALDDACGPPGSTVAHLLAHASGLGPDGGVITGPAERRIYSNAGYETVSDHVAERAGISFDDYLREAVLDPLGMTSTRLVGSAAHDAESSLTDLLRFTVELVEPRLVSRPTASAAQRPCWPRLAGVLPGFGQHDPNPWGLGPEVRGHKHPHWTGKRNSDRTFGHFGRSGSFVWVDPAVDAACVALTDHEFGPWATSAWPLLSDSVLDGLWP